MQHLAPHSNSHSSRLSNYELLRIVAMFLVLILHADFRSLGEPTFEETVDYPISSFIRIAVQSLCLVCVNVYVIISGYFGIKVRKASICNFIFTILFWQILICVASLVSYYILGVGVKPPFKYIAGSLIPGSGMWFVAAYLLLMLVSPLLNAFIQSVSANQLFKFAVVYELVQILFAWLIPLFHDFNDGYSIMSFIGLYLLGAALRRKPDLCEAIKHPLLWYVLVSIAVAGAMFVVNYACPVSPITNRVSVMFGSYNSAFIIFCSVMLFLSFGRLTIKSKAINYIAASSFAVYLFHMSPLTKEYYVDTCRYLFDNCATLEYIAAISIFIVCVYAFATIVDLFRRYLWHKIIARHIH